MSRKEYARLLAYHVARKRAPRRIGNIPSKRAARAIGSGTGQKWLQVYPVITSVVR